MLKYVLMPLHLRFIEYMPFDGNRWDFSKFVSFTEMKRVIEDKYGMLKRVECQHITDTSKVFRV
jgi:molybdenum cofactor biosynthesis enzyme MoaA